MITALETAPLSLVHHTDCDNTECNYATKIQITLDHSQDRGLVVEHSVLKISTKRRLLALRNWTFGYLVNPRLMRSLKTLILKAADCNSTILITGESGTGKELIARSIHDFGQQQREPFRGQRLVLVWPKLAVMRSRSLSFSDTQMCE